MLRMSLDKDPVLPPETPVKLSPVFTVPASLSEQPQLAKPRPLVQPKNGLQPPGGGLPAPPPPGQRIGKRRFSMGVGFRGAAKRRRRANSDSQTEPVRPSHFLLGGNIFDPLNLNSLLDEDVNRATNQETPKCSPLPSKNRDPVEILVPRDITDPLNLKGGAEEGEVAGVLLSPLKSRRRHRYRHHGGGGADGEKEAVPARLFPPPAKLAVPVATAEVGVSASPLSYELNTAITCRDDVAPPPILPRRHTHPPQGSAQKPGSHGDNRHRKRRRTTSTRSAEGSSSAVFAAPPPLPAKFQTPLVGGAKAGRCGDLHLRSAFLPQKKKKDKHRYQYGNHSRYYGYQGFYGDQFEGRVGAEEDPRLRLLEADWFRDKTVLDVGCGAGHMTLAIAMRFNPAHILGVELDQRLVHAAKQNVRHFLSHDLAVEERERTGRRSGTGKMEGGEKEENKMAEVKKGDKMEEELKKDKMEDEVKKGDKMEEELKKDKMEDEVKKGDKMEDELKKDKMEDDVKKGDKMEDEVKRDKMEDEGKEEDKMEEDVKEDNKMEDVMKDFQQALSLLSFPLSFRVSRGPLSAPPLLLIPSSSSSRFPSNITFIQGDYVSEREAWPGRGHYDVILCLGVTKWVQLQSGDGGVVRLFRRAYQSLSPGGLFILEPQPWSSYVHSKRASETTSRHYRSLRLRPEQFTSFLTDNVGFSSYRLLKNTGNQRPIYLFHKGPAHKK